jgi:hypothetical protein
MVSVLEWWKDEQSFVPGIARITDGQWRTPISWQRDVA